LRVSVVYFDLLGYQALQELVVLMRIPVHHYLPHVVEYPFQPVQTNVALMLPIAELQILLNFIVLLNPQPALGVVILGPASQVLGFGAKSLQIDVVSQIDLLRFADLLAGGVAAVCINSCVHRCKVFRLGYYSSSRNWRVNFRFNISLPATFLSGYCSISY